MARIHKVVTYIVDPDECFNKDDIERTLEDYFDANHTKVKSSGDFKWDDDLQINDVNCPVEEYEKYLDYKPISCDCYNKEHGMKIENTTRTNNLKEELQATTNKVQEQLRKEWEEKHSELINIINEMMRRAAGRGKHSCEIDSQDFNIPDHLLLRPETDDSLYPRILGYYVDLGFEIDNYSKNAFGNYDGTTFTGKQYTDALGNCVPQVRDYFNFTVSW